MAGDTSGSDIGTDVDVSDPFGDLVAVLRQHADRLGDLIDAVKGSVDRGTMFDLPLGLTVSTHVRLRVSAIVISASAAATITLTIGSGVGIRSWVIPSADTRVIPLPLVIERGVDVTLAASAGAVTGYLVAWAE